MENMSNQETITPLTDLPLNSQQREEQGERSAANVLALPSTSKETHNYPSQNVNSNTRHNDGDGAAPGNQDSDSIMEDTCCGDPGNIDNNNDSNGSDSDSVIMLKVSPPATERNQSGHPAQFDSSDDFQESPLPRTPKKTPAKKATPQSHAKKPASGVAARMRGLSLVVSKESSQGRAPGAKQVIVTRSMTSTRGSKSSLESGAAARPVKEFYSWRTRASALAKGNRPPQSSSASTVKNGQVTKPPPAKKAATSTTTATQSAKASSDNDKQVLASRSASSTIRTPTIKLTSTVKSVQTATATNKALSAKPPTPTASTKPTRNATTKSTPTSKPSRAASTASAKSTTTTKSTPSSKPSRAASAASAKSTTTTKSTPSSKPSRAASAASAKFTTTTKSTPSSKPPGKVAAKDNSTIKSSQSNSVGGIVTLSQSEGTNKSRKRGIKRRLANEDDNGAQIDAASPRKKARSSEPGSPRKDGTTSEIALHTRGLSKTI